MLGYDARALEIMREQRDTSDRNYLFAILYSRLGRKEDAVKSYVRSCDQDAGKIWRGRLDPEINTLIAGNDASTSTFLSIFIFV